MRLLVLLIAAVLAGCIDDGDEDTVSEATLSFDGADDGQHQEKAFCERGGQLTAGASVDAGALQVSVQDGDGQTVYEQTFSEDLELEGAALEGAQGGWTLTVDRRSGFEGEYAVALICS